MSLMDNLSTELERAHDQYRDAIVVMARIICYQIAIVAREKYPTSKYVVLDVSDQDFTGGQYVDHVEDADHAVIADGDEFQDIMVSDLYDANEGLWKLFAIDTAPTRDEAMFSDATYLDIDAILTAMEAE